MRRTILAGLAGRTIVIGAVVVAALGGTAAAAAGGAPASRPHASTQCVKVSVTAKPTLNTQAGSTEKLRTSITSCASAFETVRLRQQLSIRGAFNGNIQLYRHETVQIIQNIPYMCCDSHTVTDRAYSQSGKLLAMAKASWTFA
jgi:hypothetical protein